MRTYLFDDDLSLFHSLLGFLAYFQSSTLVTIGITFIFLAYELVEPENPISTIGDVVEFMTGALIGLDAHRQVVVMSGCLSYELIAQLISIVFALLSLYLGKRYKRAKKVLADLAKALEDTSKAIEDNEITPEELKKLISDWKRLIDDV